MNINFSIKSFLVIFYLLCSSLEGSGQDGVRFYDEHVMDGYTLYYSGNRAVLIDNCGHLIHEWSEVSARFHPKLLENGNIVYIENFSNRIIEKNWDDNIVNEINIISNDISPDYEVIVMESGNYLCVGRREFSQSEFNNLGYDFGFNGLGTPTQVDVVMEVDRNSGNIVWLWDISDHVIQERDPSAANYGNVSEHPELLNMDAIGTFDWTFQESFMINGFDYNEELDQIALSVRKMSEIVIIDHSTTTAEAAGHTGGNSGKGGDILYRWGNPQNYGRGNASDRRLWFQHNPNWIKYGKHVGKLIAYNNGLSSPFSSSAPIIDTPVDAAGNYILNEGQAFTPSSPTVEYGRAIGENFYSGYTSAAKVLANGNVLITVGGDDRTFEMSPDGTLVWEYGLFNSPLTFRVEKYPSNYPAFEGRDLVAGDVLEFPPSPIPCSTVGVNDQYFNKTNIWVNDGILSLQTNINNKLDLEIYSTDGRLLMVAPIQDGGQININNFATGSYLAKLFDSGRSAFRTYKLIK